jgi:hypothetical protein
MEERLAAEFPDQRGFRVSHEPTKVIFNSWNPAARARNPRDVHVKEWWCEDRPQEAPGLTPQTAPAQVVDTACPDCR